MRRINLLVTSLIGLLGLIIYFVSMPTVGDDSFVEMTVEAEDEHILENIYFSGYNSRYNQFYMDNDKKVTLDNLSYLEQLDALNDIQMYRMQQKYPEFIDPLFYDRYIQSYSIVNSVDNMFSAHIRFNEDYSIDSDTIYLNVLNKETMEIEEEEVEREDPPAGDYTDIIGMHMDYPVVQMIYRTNLWNEQTATEESTVSIGTYNIETKNYSENRPLNIEGYINTYSTSTTLRNKNKQLLTEYTTGSGSRTHYVYDYMNDELTELEDNEKHYIVGDDDQLYSVELSNNKTLLNTLDENGQETESEVTLENQLPIDLSSQDGALLTEIIDGKLYVVLNENIPVETGPGEPLVLQVFDIQNGERVLNGEIIFETESGSNVGQGSITTIGQVSTF